MEAHGSGLLGDIARKAKSFVQKHHLQDIVNPVIAKAKHLGHHAVNRASHFGHNALNHASYFAHKQLNKLQPIEGHGIVNDAIDHFGNMAVAKTLNIHSPVHNPRGRGVHTHRHHYHSGEGVFGGIFTNLYKAATSCMI